MTQTLLQLESVGVVIDGHTILDEVDWTLRTGEQWVVIGPNGGGKSTLVRVAAFTLHPTRGSVSVLGHRLGAVDIRPLRGRIGLAANSLADQLRPALTAEEVVRCGRFGALEPWWHHYDEADTDRAHHLLGTVGLGDHADRTFATLSSGERQRTLLARALMNDPEVVLLDEPTAGLDMGGRELLVAALESISTAGGPATVFVTHHVEDIPRTATHLLAVADGRVLSEGSLSDTLSADLLSKLFGVDVVLTESGGRWSARSG